MDIHKDVRAEVCRIPSCRQIDQVITQALRKRVRVKWTLGTNFFSYIFCFLRFISRFFFQLPLTDKLLAQMILLDKVVKTKVLGAPTAPNKGGVLTRVAVSWIRGEAVFRGVWKGGGCLMMYPLAYQPYWNIASNLGEHSKLKIKDCSWITLFRTANWKSCFCNTILSDIFRNKFL